MLPGNEWRSDLPPLVKERKPAGYQSGLQLWERLQGFGIIVLGLAGLFIVYGIFTGALPAGLPPPRQPEGLLVPVPTFNAVACFMPVLAITSCALIVVGFRRVL